MNLGSRTIGPEEEAKQLLRCDQQSGPSFIRRRGRRVPFVRRLSGPPWTYFGRGSLADHLRRAHGAVPRDLAGRSSRELRQMHSNAHNYGMLY